MSEVRFGPVTAESIHYVADNMRAADVTEIYEFSGRKPIEALEHAVTYSQRSAVVEIDGVPCAIFGVGDWGLLSDTGVPWMLGTEMVARNSRILLLVGEKKLNALTQGYRFLRNYVHDDNIKSKRWLARMGFVLHAPTPTGWRGAYFRKFEKSLAYV